MKCCQVVYLISASRHTIAQQNVNYMIGKFVITLFIEIVPLFIPIYEIFHYKTFAIWFMKKYPTNQRREREIRLRNYTQRSYIRPFPQLNRSLLPSAPGTDLKRARYSSVLDLVQSITPKNLDGLQLFTAVNDLFDQELQQQDELGHCCYQLKQELINFQVSPQQDELSRRYSTLEDNFYDLTVSHSVQLQELQRYRAEFFEQSRCCERLRARNLRLRDLVDQFSGNTAISAALLSLVDQDLDSI